jgi:CRP-like cAMP-binding protein
MAGVKRQGSAALEGLGSLPMFRHVPATRVAALAREARTAHAARGAVIARRGERLAELGVVARGLVKIALKGDPEKVLRLAGPGETFGEEALFLDRPLAVEVSALADTLLVMVPRRALLRLLEADARFARELLAGVCQRLDALVADFEAATQHGARERLAAYLHSLGTADGKAVLPASKTVVAARLAMTKETLSRLLHRLSDEGLIAVHRREIRLLDPARLAAAARRA